MSARYNVFSGIFTDEVSQRFLRAMHDACNNAFDDLYDHSMPQNPKRYRDCLDRVPSWDASVLKDELHRTCTRFAELESTFRNVYISFVKAMRGASNMKLMVNVPRLQDVFRSYFVNVSKHKSIRDGAFFRNKSLLEQRVACLDALRDTLFEYLDDEHVKLEEKTLVSHPPDADTASTVRLDDANTVYRNGSTQGGEEKAHSKSREVASDIASDVSHSSRRKRQSDKSEASTHQPPLHRDDAESTLLTKADDLGDATQKEGVCDEASRVVSNVFEDHSSEDDVCPEDSVSNADFAAKQKREAQKHLQRSIDTDESSRTSLSLSSISISENGEMIRKPVASDSALSVSSAENNSSACNRKAKTRKVRSYMDELVEE